MIGDVNHRLGTILYQKEEYQQAHEQFQKAINIFEALFGENCREISEVANNAGIVFWEEEKFQEAMDQFKNAEKIAK